jgi:hypothetical protein
VRPTLGGLGLAIAVLLPLIAARPLSIEKERRTFGARCLHVGSPARVVLTKSAAAVVASAAALLVSPLVLFGVYRAMGGHLDAIETGIALSGEALHLLFVLSVSIAAAAWTKTLAQAVTLGIIVSLSSWAIEAADGFAALAWLGGASAWSIERRLAPFQDGILALGSIAWLVLATGSSLALAVVGAELGWPRTRRALAAIAVIGVGCAGLARTAEWQRGYDWSEQRRASLPPAAVAGLRSISAPIALDVYLDRDDSRRHQLEGDVLAKLLLARADLIVRTPLDAASEVREMERDASYGRVIVHVGDAVRETRSTSRREITTLVFEAAGMPLPDWSQPAYPGFPLVLQGARRTALLAIAYAVVPLSFVGMGLWLTRRRTNR